MFTTYGENRVFRMTNFNTLASLSDKLKRAILLGGALALLLPAGIAIADEENQEAADLIIAAEEALNESRYQDASREYRAAAMLSENPEVAKTATRIAYSYEFNDDAVASARGDDIGR